MDQHVPSEPALGTPGELPVVNREIAGTFHFGVDSRLPDRFQRSTQNESLGALDVFQLRRGVDRQDHRKIQRAETDHDGPSAARAAGDLDPVALAGLEIEILAHPARGSQDDGGMIEFPDPQDRWAFSVLGLDEQGLVKGDVVHGGRERHVEQLDVGPGHESREPR